MTFSHNYFFKKLCQIYLTFLNECNIIMSYIFDIGGFMINQKLKDARINKGLSQLELARIVNVSRQTINMIENNDYNPTIALCIKICKALNKTLDELFWEAKNE